MILFMDNVSQLLYWYNPDGQPLLLAARVPWKQRQTGDSAADQLRPVIYLAEFVSDKIDFPIVSGFLWQAYDDPRADRVHSLIDGPAGAARSSKLRRVPIYWRAAFARRNYAPAPRAQQKLYRRNHIRTPHTSVALRELALPDIQGREFALLSLDGHLKTAFSSLFSIIIYYLHRTLLWLV